MKPNKDMKTDKSQKKPTTPPSPQQTATMMGRVFYKAQQELEEAKKKEQANKK